MNLWEVIRPKHLPSRPSNISPLFIFRGFVQALFKMQPSLIIRYTSVVGLIILIRSVAPFSEDLGHNTYVLKSEFTHQSVYHSEFITITPIYCFWKSSNLGIANIINDPGIFDDVVCNVFNGYRAVFHLPARTTGRLYSNLFLVATRMAFYPY